MGIITDKIKGYRDNKLTFAALEAFLIAVKWKEPGWMSRPRSDFATVEDWSDWKDGFDVCEEGTWGEVECAVYGAHLLTFEESNRLLRAVQAARADVKEVDVEDIV